MNNTFYMFRHGLATKSMKGYADNIVNAELLPEGIQQAYNIGEFLKGVKSYSFFSSEYQRCTQTASIISTIIGTSYITDKRLNEYYKISFTTFVAQLTSFLIDISKFKNQNILVCTHVANMIVLKKILFKENLQEKDIFTNYPLPGILQIIHGATIKEINVNTI